MSHPPPPKLTSSTSSSSIGDHFPNLRQFFQRSSSHPNQEAAHHHYQQLHAAAISPESGESAALRAFGACTQVLSTAVTALFHAINAFGAYDDAVSPPIDPSMTRRAKLLYVQLLDAAQKERGEACGFRCDDDRASASATALDDEPQHARDSVATILATYVADLPRTETFALLNELVDVSFLSMRGPLVDAALYAKHKRQSLQTLSLGIPASLHALLEVRALLNELARDEKLCLFRLLALWHAMAVVRVAHDLSRTIQDKHHLVFSDCSELEFLCTRKDPRHDALAIALLHVLVLYHDVLFSDVEFLLVKQELQLNASLQTPSEPGTAASSDPVAATLSSPVHTSEVAAHTDVVEPAAAPAYALDQQGLDQQTRADVALTADRDDVTGESMGAERDATRADDADGSQQQQRTGKETAAAVRPASGVTSRVAMARSSSHARTHGPVVSIRPHTLAPRKSARQTKRPSFEALTTATEDAKAWRHPRRHSHGSSSSKSDDVRPSSYLDAVTTDVSPTERITDSSGDSSGNSKCDTIHNTDSSGDAVEQQAGVEYRSVEQVSVEQIGQPAPHEVTDLANTYFSFSFTAATMRTVAIMAYYALRRHQHN